MVEEEIKEKLGGQKKRERNGERGEGMRERKKEGGIFFHLSIHNFSSHSDSSHQSNKEKK